jgi:methyl-accepting chemotaxis protein
VIAPRQTAPALPRSPIARVVLGVIGLDTLLSALFAYCLFVLLGIEGAAARTAAGVCAVAFVLKCIGWAGLIEIRLRPLSLGGRGPRRRVDAATIRQIAAAAYRAPGIIGVSWAVMTTAFWGLVTLVLYFWFPDAVPLGPRSLEAILILSPGLLLSAMELMLPLAEWLIAPFVERMSLIALDRGIAVPGRGLSFRGRMVAFALTLALAPTLFLAGLAYMNDARAGERDLARRARLAVAEAALGDPDAAQRAGGRVFELADGHAADRALADRPLLARELERAAAAAPSGLASHPREGVVAFRAAGEQRIGVVILGPVPVSSGTVLLILLSLLIMALWAPMSALFIARSTAIPVARLSEALARVGGGELQAAPRVPVFHQDEIGALAVAYNAMLDQLRELARRAAEVSGGALDVELGVRGELGDAFRGQLASLRDIVGHIAHSAARLAGAAGEMYAAAQEQEQAARHQSAGIEEVSCTMESLLAAATHVTESTTGVLMKAERTRETTARTAERIAELSEHAGRIGEILEVIREIADRSDLLALSASLEGTRAGEAGRGFALVAGEMRKLAERVTASVRDIKKLVSDVRASVSATAVATEESSKLADGTTESARQINLVTQQQRSGTEQAGHSMRDVASMITQSLAATQQIRSLAEDLKAQADNLTALVARFRLAPPSPELPREVRA